MSTARSGEQSAAVFLGQRHAEQFQALGELTGQAAEILEPTCYKPTATQAERDRDYARVRMLAQDISWRSAGPLSAEDIRDGQDITTGSKTITTNAASAPVRTPSGGQEWFPWGTVLSENVSKYLQGSPRNNDFLDIATGRYSHYYGCNSRVLLAGTGNSLDIVSPIGEYGTGAALGLMDATYRSMRGPETYQIPLLDELANTGDNRRLILRHTTWGRNERAAYGYKEDDDFPLGKALARSVFEGDLSIQQEISLLTAEAIEGFSTLASLWKAIRKAKLVEEITRLLPFGDLASITSMNAFIPGLVEPDGKGGVMLNSEKREQLKVHKREVQDDLMQFFKKHPEKEPGDDMGIFCPALAHSGGLALRHEVVYRQFIEGLS